jgi:hypothetical protein
MSHLKTNDPLEDSANRLNPTDWSSKRMPKKSGRVRHQKAFAENTRGISPLACGAKATSSLSIKPDHAANPTGMESLEASICEDRPTTIRINRHSDGKLNFQIDYSF